MFVCFFVCVKELSKTFVYSKSRSTFKVSNEISTILWFFQAWKDHLGARNVLLRIEQVLVQRSLVPFHRLGFVCCRIRVSCCSSRRSPEQSLQVGSLLVAFRGGDAVALGAFGLEDLLPRLAISFGRLSKCCHTKNTMRGLARRKFWDLRLKEE